MQSRRRANCWLDMIDVSGGAIEWITATVAAIFVGIVILVGRWLWR
jgi:hypothetical protein